jgi:hypothetical protein
VSTLPCYRPLATAKKTPVVGDSNRRYLAARFGMNRVTLLPLLKNRERRM